MRLTFSRARGPVLAVALLALGGCDLTQPGRPHTSDFTQLEARLDWYLTAQMKKLGVPGVSIALVDADGVLWHKAYGYADREARTPATTQTLYQVGSISKLITATAVMQQVERGALDLDAPIARYLPEFSMHSRWGDARRLTLREMLAHHAGLPTYYLKGFFSDAPLASLVTALKDEHLAYPPRAVFNYSNLGPDIAGAALERLSGRSFDSAVRSTLLEPLGMPRSSFTLTDTVRAAMAHGHVKGRPRDPIPIRDAPAGGLVSNVEELARFMRMVLRGGELDGVRVLKPETVTAMLTPQFTDAPYDFGQHFGLGWMLSGIPLDHAGRTAWHNGGTKSFLSQLIVLPEKNLGVVVLANADSAAPLVYETAETLLRLALEVRDGIRPNPPPAKLPEIALDAVTLERYAGDYSLMGALVHLRRRDNRLEFQLFEHRLELVPVGGAQFRAEYRLAGPLVFRVPTFPPIEFVERDGRVILVMRDRGIAMTGEKVPAYEIPAAWRRRVGPFRIVNPDKHYLVDTTDPVLTVEDGRLLLRVKLTGIEEREIKVVMMPLDDERVYTFGLGRNVGDITQIVRRDGRELIRYLGYYFDCAGCEQALQRGQR